MSDSRRASPNLPRKFHAFMTLLKGRSGRSLAIHSVRELKTPWLASGKQPLSSVPITIRHDF